MLRTPLRLALICAAGVLTVTACAEPAPLPPAPVPPAAPPPPPVAMSGPMLEAAAVYRAYVRRVSALSPAYADGDSVEAQLVQAESYEPKQFLKGTIAYGALVALQSPNFVAAVRTYAVDPAGRRDLAERLIRDPHYAQVLPSAAGAAGLVAATLNADAQAVRHAGDLVKQAAYDVQKQKWAGGAVPTPANRLAQAKVLSAQVAVGAVEDVEQMRMAMQARPDSVIAADVGPATQPPMSPPYTGVLDRALALAALAALGEAVNFDEASLQPLYEEQAGAFCLNLSKLNLYQCLSVAKPYYEDVFCLGQHVLLDTAQCLSKASGYRPPPVPATSVSAVEQSPPVGAAASVKLKD